MFRPDTYKRVLEHNTVGVRREARARFAKIRRGDRFVTYVAKEKLLDGYGEIASDPFEDNTLIFSDRQIYEHRCRVRFVAHSKAVEAGNILWYLSPYINLGRTTPTNMIFCQGGFALLSTKDYEMLIKHLAPQNHV